MEHVQAVLDRGALKYRNLRSGEPEDEAEAQCTRVTLIGGSVFLAVVLVVAVTAGVLAPKSGLRADVYTLTDDMQKLLDAHNRYRAKHGAPALAWDQGLADDASEWAAKCVWGHGGIKSGEGENLWAGAGIPMPTAIAGAADPWYDEIKAYNFSAPAFSSATGHFTQVVWKSTTTVGCAAKTCGVLTGLDWHNAVYISCRYRPPGNVVGGYQANVLPPAV